MLLFSKIIKKNEIEPNYNWNKRVRLPEENDKNLLAISKNNTLIQYIENDTEKCDEGCEIFFQIKNYQGFMRNLEFSFYDGEYKDPPSPTPTSTPAEEKGEKDKLLWVKITVPIVAVILIVIIIIFVVKKYKKNKEIENINDSDKLGLVLNDV